ncbi:hypothetical protein JZX86_27495 [Agrobacterium rosae]|uniref:hypothetical protein n=1 Tax=Agrobacterium rosae TaxID=1972867 RepID=UPI0019D36740|nr:hypothetical protein [Agrobacterium rosae]MBN7809068.1 hypothetical protein [Agrobacterium rosae]
MTMDDHSKSFAPNDRRLSSDKFAADPDVFLESLAETLNIEVEDETLLRLSERLRRGATREEIVRVFQNIKGVPYELDYANAAFNFSRLGIPGAVLIIENLLSFAPNDNKAFVIRAFSQVLDRHPDSVELARHTHNIDVNGCSRLDLLAELNAKSTSEGRIVIWDSAEHIGEKAATKNVRGLIESTGFRSISKDTHEKLTLCRYQHGQWELAPSMVCNPAEVQMDSWRVSDGFFLTGPKAHLSAGKWLLDIDIVQPASACVIIDVVANLAVDRLLYLTVYGSLRGTFSFEKLNTHAFLEVRFQTKDAVPGQWISIQNVQLSKIDI